MLVEGKLVEKNLVTALQWLSLAQANGSNRAEKFIKELLLQMSPSEAEKAKTAIFHNLNQ